MYVRCFSISVNSGFWNIYLNANIQLLFTSFWKNTSECKVLTVTRKKTPIAFDYTLDGTALTRVSEGKDLGVIITSTLSWDSHIHTITAKANKLLGLLKRTCPLLSSVSVRRSLYLSLVKSQLFYATQVWSPAYVTLNAKVEQVQRRASRWMLRTRKDESSYKDRLTLLDYFHFL